MIGFDWNLSVKSSVWASCEAADETRENAEKRDLFRRCILHTERGGRWFSSFPDQLPGFPVWVRLLTMLVIVVGAFILAMLPGMGTATEVAGGADDSRATDAGATYAFSLANVQAIAISLDRGAVTFETAAVGSTSTDLAIVVSQSVASAAESSLSSLSTVVTLDESTGVLAVTGTWSGGVEAAHAAPCATLQLTIPRDAALSIDSVEVTIGAAGAGFGTDDSSDLSHALSTPWLGFAAPVGDITWRGDSSSTSTAASFDRVSLATVEGSIAATDLRAVEVSAASDHGASISLTAVSAHVMTIASGVAAIDAEIVVTGSAAAGVPGSALGGGWLAVSTASASSVRLSIDSGATEATVVEVDCGTVASESGATCMLEGMDTAIVTRLGLDPF